MSVRSEVLKAFRNLHKTRKVVFEGDTRALNLAREKINEEFKKNMNLTDHSKIKELVDYTKNVEKELKTTVIQAREVEPGTYEAIIRNDTVRMDNVPFKDHQEGKSKLK